MARQKNATDEQILNCIVQLEKDGRKVTIAFVSSELHVRRNRVQLLLAQHKAEQKAEQERQAKMTPTVADLQTEVDRLKKQVADLQADNAYLRERLKSLRVCQTFDHFDFSTGLPLVADEKPENP